jgi:hypothetical protein
MNASKLFVAVAAVAFAGSTFAADLTGASAAATSAAAAIAAPAGYAAKNLNIPSATIGKSGTQNRAEVRAEAVEAVKAGRSAFQDQLDFIKG